MQQRELVQGSDDFQIALLVPIPSRQGYVHHNRAERVEPKQDIGLEKVPAADFLAWQGISFEYEN